LLLHDGLNTEQLALVTGMQKQDIALTLDRLIRAELVGRAEASDVFRVAPLGYPAVRKNLQARGYPVDGF
jgi:hypothetical protein